MRLLGDFHTVDPIVDIKGNWGIVLRLVISTPIGDLPIFETLDGLVNYVSRVLSVLYGGAARAGQEPDTEGPWLNCESEIVRPARDG